MPSITCNDFEISWVTNRNTKSDLTLILVAGAGGRHLDWPKELRHNRLVNTIAVDLPGHFKLSGDPCITIEQMADVICCLVEDQKLKKVVVAGHSMGGLVAQEIGLRQFDWLDSLILMGTAAVMPVHPAILGNIHTDLDKAADFVTKYAWSGKGYGLVTGAVRKAIMENRPETLYADFVACNVFDVRDRLSEILVPTLVIGGQRDKFTPLKQSEFMTEHIPNAELHILSAAGHYMAQEQPLPLTRVITSFLKRRQLDPK
ncbi:MAG: pimeloyl-ACP methyl ester carboxylesterase [Cellvibrionaceae bacterium]|jgi:pimeloyl-ACP methyl ester carboxylesterase